ncbi:uncharacterized protein [Fopius arisanus]|uniref:Uncharacterized protein n=1 Tax=Fopius arisanus TaxID=64838 RepID=A0A9R1U107_9HYME|nr:PREDICTED: uncharacterized protein LOC105266595 [Fopius arisanus]
MQYVADVSEEVSQFVSKSGSCVWDTGELVLDILLEFVTRSIELGLSVLALGFQVLCIFRDLLIDALRTFANAIKGIVNVVGAIDIEDVEDFASACIVVILWIGAGKFMLGVIEKSKGKYSPMQLFTRMMDIYNEKLKEPPPCPRPSENTWIPRQHSSRKKSSHSRGRRNSKKR